MTLKSTIVFIFLSLTIFLKAEELPSFTITELSTYSSKILEAKFLKVNGISHIFLTRDIHSKAQFTDTLNLDNLGHLYDPSTEKRVSFANCEKLIIYISDSEGMGKDVTISGFRLLKDGRIFSPFQPTNPGGYSFAGSDKVVDWNVFKERIIRVHRRITSVKDIKEIANPIIRNEKLLAWIDRFKSSFRKQCDFDADCGWGMFEWDVFRWITLSENAKDTWKASQLYRAVNATSEVDWHKESTILREEKGSSFRTYEDIDFLLNIAIDQKRIVEERRQALVFLSPAVDIVYDNNDPLVDSINFAFQVGKQKSIRQSVYELMAEPDLRYNAFQVLKPLTNPKSYGLLHRTDLGHLPQIIEHYTQVNSFTEDRTYATTSYKSDLAYFIARNSSAGQWRDLTDCDANILMDIKQVHIDTLRNTIDFSVYYSHGKEVIKEMPTVVLTSLADGKEDLFHEGFECNVPWQGGSRYIRMDLKSMGLEDGEYRCHLIGKAGEDSDFFWTSKFVNFRIGN